MATGLENLKIYQMARELELRVHSITKVFPREEKFRSVDQLNRSAAATANNIAEAYYKTSTKDKIHVLRNIVIAEAEETRGNILQCAVKKFLPLQEAESIAKGYVEFQRAVFGFIRFLRDNPYTPSIPQLRNSVTPQHSGNSATPQLRNSATNGFTLVELLIVLTIIGILLAAAISSYQLVRVRSRDGKRATDLSQVSAALALYDGKYHMFPADIYASSASNPPGLAPEFMNLVPRDPLGGAPYAYAVPAARNEYHLGVTIEGGDSALRDVDSDFNSAAFGWNGGFAGDDAAGPCLLTQAGSFCYDIVERK